MNKWKIYALVVSIFALGALKEIFCILTPDARDIKEHRSSLIPTAILLTGGLVFLAIKFWRKSSNRNLYNR